MRILFIQFGNYAEAEHRFAKGGDETFYAQRYSVGYVAELARKGNAVRVVTIGENAPLEQLPSGVESMGLQVYTGRFHRPRTREVIAMAAPWRPSHLILVSPVLDLLRWAMRNRVETLPLLADSFRAPGIRRRIGYRRLAAALNDPAIRWVVNHGRNAAADLVRIGVDARKVLPFDWPSLLSPANLASKTAPSRQRVIWITYAGQISMAKGVGDLIEAVAIAQKKGVQYGARIVGRGEIETFRQLAGKLGVESKIDFTGAVPHERVLQLMHEGDVVVVPSRPEYPEGVPQTIYEGLASRTPVAVSNHPMFDGRVVHRKSGMVFQAASPQALFDAVEELVSDTGLYERLSKDAVEICTNFHEPLKWDQVISRWLSATAADDAWLRQFALAR